MPYTSYQYAISDTLNNQINEESLIATIIASEQEGFGPFSVVFDHVEVDGGTKTFKVWFKNELPGIEHDILTNIVHAHTGEPLRPINVVELSGPKQDDGTPKFVDAPREGDERVIGTHNFCDPCSWFGDSVRVAEATLTDSGDHLTFTSAHENWIDMISGRMHNDGQWVQIQQMLNPGDPHGYQVVVKVDGVEKTMREPFETEGGDYEVYWDEGNVVFFEVPTGVVTASYSYATTNAFHLQPLPGKILVIEDAEADISNDLIMTDAILYGGWYFNGSEWVLDAAYEFKRASQIATEARGNYPIFKAVGATEQEKALPLKEFRRKSRGMMVDRQPTPFNYATVRHVIPGTELRVWTKHGRAFEGEHVTMTFYCTETDAPA